MHASRVVYFWSPREPGCAALAERLGKAPGLVLASLDAGGKLPTEVPASDQVVIVADWARLAANAGVIAHWRRTLAPTPFAVVAEVERGELGEALLRLDALQVDDFLEWPWTPEQLLARIRTAARRLALREAAPGLETTGTQAAADFREFHRVALALSAEGDVDRLLELIVTKCRELTSADAGSLYLVEEPAIGPGAAVPEQALRFVVAQNDSKPLTLKRATLPLDRSSIAGYVALTRRPLRLDDVYRLPDGLEFRFNRALDQAFGYRTKSMLVMPMVDHTDTVIGVVQLINKKRSAAIRLDTPEVAEAEVLPFGIHDQEMVGSLASLAAVVSVRGRQGEEERRELEAQLRQSQKMEAVGRLAGGVAHDFNNLLTVITGRGQLLLYRMAPDDPQRRHVELMLQTADRAAALTRQLLAFSRRQVLELRLVDLNEVVAGAEAILRQLIGEDIVCQVVRGVGLGLTRADPHQLEQVIMNLAVNGRDAMPHGGRLTIETGNVELEDTFVRRHPGARAGRYVALTVRDTGIGMDADVQAQIFEPFFTTKEPGKGTGLGLAMVYGIVKQHQGYIAVDSQPGRGAAFTIYLPRAEERLEVRPRPGGSDPTPTGSETILLVEDEDAVRELAREILEVHGYRLLTARNGIDALSMSARHPGGIDLLLTDVVMPEMGGRALADRLRAARPGLKVLFMSGYTADAIAHHGVLDPGTILLLKPFTPEGLARKVREVLSAPATGA